MVSYSFEAEINTLTITFGSKISPSEIMPLTTAVTKAADELLATASNREEARIAFDLEKLDSASSLFLRLALIIAKKVKPNHFSVKNCNPFIKNLFQMSGFEQWMAAENPIECRPDAMPSFPPNQDFVNKAHIRSREEFERLYRRSIEQPDAFWKEQAETHLVWDQIWRETTDFSDPKRAKWFVGGKLNVSYNCLDKHVLEGNGHKTAIIWEGERPGEEQKISYQSLHQQVCRFANVLARQGITKGDRVIVYMPMIPEAVVAMLGCTRIGAIHSVVFGGFSAEALADRIADSGAKMIVTTDGGYRKGAVVPLKENVDRCLKMRDETGALVCQSVEKVIVHRRCGMAVSFSPPRDLWWDAEMAAVPAACPHVPMDSEDTLFILYTSGSTGKPKGVFHSTAGYLLGAKLSHHYIFDIQASDIFWCTADIGWITGHSYLVYGPLSNGTTVLLYEGVPNYPDPSRFWQIIEKHRVTILYTAPTAIRSFMQWGIEWVENHDLSSLRLLGTVGEPINPPAWMWYYENIGKSRCPIVDTWWQTETGSILLSALPGAVPAKPGSAALPFFGIDADVVDANGAPMPINEGGKLVIRRPWPSMLRGVWGDDARYELTYWSDVPDCYFTGDGAYRDADGYLWIIGRIDDVINVSGHRIGTAEIESAMVSHPAVAEAGAVGRADDLKGSALIVFATLRKNFSASPELREELRGFLAAKLGPVMRPDEMRIVELLPKTRSGKIMRRLLKQVAAGTEIQGDMTTLEDLNVLARLSGESQ